MRFLRNSALAFAGLFAALLISAVGAGDEDLYPPKPGAPTTDVWVVSHGWHAALIIDVGDLGRAAEALSDDAPKAAATLSTLARAMNFAEWVEIGWGDEGFYRADAVSAVDVSPGVIAAALFTPTETVAHVFPGLGPPREAFPGSDVARVALGEEGYLAFAKALAASLEATGDGALEDLGPGLYGDARFFRATGVYSLINTCNNWVARTLRAGGVASSGAFSTFAAGLMTELRIRNRGVL